MKSRNGGGEGASRMMELLSLQKERKGAGAKVAGRMLRQIALAWSRCLG